MNPDLDLRLKSVLKAMQDVILPALPADQRLARDQAALVIGHLSIIAEQWQHALDYERENLALACALAREMSIHNHDPLLADELSAVLLLAQDLDHGSYRDVSDVHRRLKSVIDRVLLSAAGEQAMTLPVIKAVLHYNRQRAPRERIWHAAARLDPDAAQLPPIAALFPPKVR